MEANPPSGSLAQTLGLPSPEDLSLKGEERVLAVLAREVDELKKQLHEVRTEQVLKETQLPPEILEQLGLPPAPMPPRKRGRGYRPILSTEITEAKKQILEKRGFVNEAMVARYLGVSYQTYKKYALMYGLWEPKPNVKGERNIFDPERGKYPLSEILQGKHPDYPVFRIKDKLIRSGIKIPNVNFVGIKKKELLMVRYPLF